MAHTVIDGHAIIDWETGDPEGDRRGYFKALRYFVKELKNICNEEQLALMEKWHFGELNVDDFPRMGITYPEDFAHD